MTDYKKWIIARVLAILLFVSGFFVARYTDKPGKPDIEYITLPPVHDTVKIEVPKWKEYPKEEIDSMGIAKYLYKEGKLDFLVQDVDGTVVSVDTAEIIKEFVTKNKYEFNVFDIDTLGKLDVALDVQYNQLGHFEYNYSPIQKQITRTNRPSVEFVLGAGVGICSNPKVNGFMLDADAGIFIKQHYGLEYEFQWNWNNYRVHNLKFKYKF